MLFFRDSFGQLIREDNPTLDKTLTYCYDNIGNITNVKTFAYTTESLDNKTATATEAYTYDTAKKDRVTRIADKTIYYNGNGNIRTYGSYRYSWIGGKLRGISSGSSSQASLYTNCLLTYNGLGQRTKKDYTYNTNPLNSNAYGYRNISTYTYDHGGRLIREYNEDTTTYTGGSTSTRELIFLYDGEEIIGLMHRYGNTALQPYYFRKNLQGDVTAIYDASGTKIGEYTYDAWGNCSVTYGIGKDVVRNNPIRYRSYYYDKETNLYYLNARYYDPALRRFISLDSTEYLDPDTPNGLNLYAYCNNDPVNYADPSGNSVIASILISFAVSSLFGWGLSATFGSQIAGGIGSIGGGATAVSTSMSLCALGPWGVVAGIALMAAGGLTIAFGVNEIVDGATGTNYIQNWFGWSDSVYNGVYIGLNIASAIGSIAGNVYLNAIRTNALNGLDDAVYGPKASQHIGERSYYDSKLTMREIVKYGKIRKAKYGVPGYEFRIKGYSVMGKSGNIHRGVWSLVYGKGVIWHFLLG